MQIYFKFALIKILCDILHHIMTPEYRTKYDMETFLGELADGKEGLDS